MKSICGRLLEVDLASGKTKDFPVSEDLFRKYLGGRGLGARLLFDVLPPRTDPFSPENVLFFMTGPLTGTNVAGSSKFVVVTKSPLTGGWCDSYSSGRISVELKKAGYDGMVIRGKSNHPCYLRIDNRRIEIREADRLWGKDSFETEGLLKEMEKDASAGVSSIGPAGERLSKIACINSDLYRQAGRGGVGAVMGSKNLKAIVVKGGKGIDLHDRKRVVDLNRNNYQRALKSPVAGEAFNIGSGITTTVKEVVEMIAEITGTTLKPEYAPQGGRFGLRHLHLDVTKAEKGLGFKAEVLLREGLKRYFEWRKKKGTYTGSQDLFRKG